MDCFLIVDLSSDCNLLETVNSIDNQSRDFEIRIIHKYLNFNLFELLYHTHHVWRHFNRIFVIQSGYMLNLSFDPGMYSMNKYSFMYTANRNISEILFSVPIVLYDHFHQVLKQMITKKQNILDLISTTRIETLFKLGVDQIGTDYTI